MQHLKAAPNPYFLNAFVMGVLTKAQMHGAAPFPWPSPCAHDILECCEGPGYLQSGTSYSLPAQE
eukprot:15357809-Ditylum_brightwellii.AAC.1